MEPEQNKDSGNEVENLYSDREGDDEGATNAVVDSSEPSSVQPSPPPVLAEICALPPPIPVPVLDTESTTPVVSVSTEEIAPAESANITDMTTDKPKKRKKKSASKKKKTSGRKTGKPTAPVAFASTEEIAFAEIPSLTDMVTDKPKTCNKKSAPKKKKTSGRKPGKPRRGDPRAAQKNSVPVVKAVVVPTKVHTHHPSHYGNRPSESTDQKSSGSSISSKDKGIPIATVIGGDHYPDDGFDLEKGVAKPKHRFYKSRYAAVMSACRNLCPVSPKKTQILNFCFSCFPFFAKAASAGCAPAFLWDSFWAFPFRWQFLLSKSERIDDLTTTMMILRAKTRSN
jgi:hypothetical protein